jgi:hypothetical protein
VKNRFQNLPFECNLQRYSGGGNDEPAKKTTGGGGKSYYEIIDGNKYDRKVLDDCRAAMGDGVIEIAETVEIMVDVLDGRVRHSRVSDCLHGSYRLSFLPDVLLGLSLPGVDWCLDCQIK